MSRPPRRARGADPLDGAGQVAICVPDNFGRLAGKRLPAARWAELRRDGLAMPDFHLVTDAENRPYPDLEVTGAHTGYRNGVLMPLPETRFRVATEPGTAFVLAEALDAGRRPREEAPRRILERQLARLAERGLAAAMASELEFYLFRCTVAEAAERGFRRLPTDYPRHADNDLLVAGYAEPFLAELRAALALAGIAVTCTQGEGGLGQFEVNTAHGEPLATADRHVIFKHVAKALAEARGRAVSFMAKLDAADAGSSGHVHLSIADRRGRPAIGRDGALAPFGRAFLAGLLAFTPDFALLHAPFANSYRRLQHGSMAPSRAAWAFDNRSAMIRVLADRAGSLRLEFRLPGADMNPYLSFAAILAAGLAGVEQGLEPPPPATGDIYAGDAPRLPGDLTESVAAFTASPVAAAALGAPVHRHLAGFFARERDAGRRAVTDWELRRGFDVA